MVLLEAAERYDSAQGASFETYAAIRVRGAMLDEVRNSEWAPRSVQRKARQLSKAMDEVSDLKERDPKDTEVAERLGMPLEQYRELFREAAARKVISLEEVAGQEDLVASQFDDWYVDPFAAQLVLVDHRVYSHDTPEPATGALIALGALALLFLQRRPRR